MTIPTTTLIPRLWSLRHEMQRIMEELPDLWLSTEPGDR